MTGPMDAPTADGPQVSNIPTGPVPRSERQPSEPERQRAREYEQVKVRASAEAKRIYLESLKKQGIDDTRTKPQSDAEREAMLKARQKAMEKYREYLERKKGDKGKEKKKR